VSSGKRQAAAAFITMRGTCKPDHAFTPPSPSQQLFLRMERLCVRCSAASQRWYKPVRVLIGGTFVQPRAMASSAAFLPCISARSLSSFVHQRTFILLCAVGRPIGSKSRQCGVDARVLARRFARAAITCSCQFAQTREQAIHIGKSQESAACFRASS
jgi:hypothetical protein